MRRSYLILALVGAIPLLALVVWQTTPGSAQPAPASGARLGAAQPDDPMATIPLSHVILFNSGVGYFQREGTVEGTARVDLRFPVGDVNDLLKSLVLQDVDKGHVKAISYDSQEPIDKTLKSYALDLTYNPTFGQLLNQARGEKIEITLQQSGAGGVTTLTGVIMGLESRMQGTPPHEADFLNLVCSEGVRNFPLAQVQRMRFLNPTLDGEFRRALEVLANSHDSMKKTVSLNFQGEGKRRVKVGYVLENPMWKASYRLVLKDEDRGPLLQGWALVENTSDEDWKDVRMTLVSGRPISFQMDLYQPLFIPRPMVEPERFASLRPPTYNAAMTPGQGGQNLGLGGLQGNLGVGGFQGNFGVGGFAGGMMGGQFNPLGNTVNPFVNRYQIPMGGQMGQFGQLGFFAGNNFGQGGNPANPTDTPDQQQNFLNNNRLTYQQLQDRRRQQQQAKNDAKRIGSALALDPSGVASVATADEIGDHFKYDIDDRISLPRQKSAMLPIVNKEIAGRRVSIYNASVHTRFPLLGLKIKNTSGLNLMQGPVAVYEGGAYAGDARISDLQPDEERFLSYAIDLGSEVNTVRHDSPEQLTAVRIVKGIIHATHKLRMTSTYTVANRSKHDRKVVLEHPISANWKLVEPTRPTEQSRDVYRFEVAVPAGKTVEQKITEEQMRVTQFALNFKDDQKVRVLLASTVTPEKVKKALEKATEYRNKQASLSKELAQVEKQLRSITEDQTRMRANLDKVPPSSAAYKRYLEKFDKQETEIEKLQKTITAHQEALKELEIEYEDFLAKLTVE